MTALTAAAPHFTDRQLADFHATGVVRLGGVIDDSELAALRQRIDDIMLGKKTFAGMMQLDSDSGNYGDMPAQSAGHKGATLNYRKIEGLEADPLFLAYLRKPLIRSLATRILGPDVSIYRSMFMNKPAGKGTILPWHQDGGTGWNLTGNPLVTIWLALDPATRDNGCVQVIPGSHHLGLLSERGHTITAEQEAEHCRRERHELHQTSSANRRHDVGFVQAFGAHDRPDPLLRNRPAFCRRRHGGLERLRIHRNP